MVLADSPLILGTNLTDLDPTDPAMLENKAVISVDQDGVAAGRIADSGNGQVFSKRESNGDYVIALYNTSATATTTVSAPGSAGIRARRVLTGNAMVYRTALTGLGLLGLAAQTPLHQTAAPGPR